MVLVCFYCVVFSFLLTEKAYIIVDHLVISKKKSTFFPLVYAVTR